MGFKFLGALTLISTAAFASPSDDAKKVAEYAVKAYGDKTVTTLEKLVSYKTFAVNGVKAVDNPEHIAFKSYLEVTARQLGLDYADHGAVAIISLGDSEKKLGIVTHGDIQPADPSKWKMSPFTLDQTSEPGKLIGRGTEDDKGPIATALYAMKAIKDKGIKLNRKIELFVALTEESDWGPLQEFAKTYPLPDMNITIDASYPVVVAEKGWGAIFAKFEKQHTNSNSAYIESFKGGAFISQIPENGFATLVNVSDSDIEKIKTRTKSHKGVSYTFKQEGNKWTISSQGVSAHSSAPEQGINGIAHLADALNVMRWPNNHGVGAVVNFINDYIGLDLYGKDFGDIAYRDDFMGPMSVALTLITEDDNSVNVGINLRRPVGKEQSVLKEQIDAAMSQWQRDNNVKLADVNVRIGDPMMVKNAPHVQPLLDVFAHYTEHKNPQPVSIGGSTNAKLLPNAVSFGPSMPGVKYSGHSEHEFITKEQFILNLRMYTAMMIEIGMMK